MRRRAQPKSERAQLEEMFDSIMQEIEERRSFLQDLEGKRALKQEMLYQVRCACHARMHACAHPHPHVRSQSVGQDAARLPA